MKSKLFFFYDYVVNGVGTDLKNVSNSIILGKGLAEKLMANVGDVVVVTTSQGERFSLKVVGYFQSGLMELDKVQSYASIATTQKLLGKSNNYITDIQIKLKDVTLAPQLAKEYAEVFQTDAEDIQTAGEDEDTNDEQPAGGSRQPTWPASDRPRHGQQPHGVIHLITYAGFEIGQHIGRQGAL